MVVLVTCKNEEDPIKNEGTSANKIFPVKSLWEFFQTLKGSYLCCRIGPNFELIQAFMVILGFKNEKDPIKNEGSRALS